MKNFDFGFYPHLGQLDLSAICFKPFTVMKRQDPETFIFTNLVNMKEGNCKICIVEFVFGI